MAKPNHHNNLMMLNEGLWDKFRAQLVFFFLIKGQMLWNIFSCLSLSEIYILKWKAVIICLLNLFSFVTSLPLSVPVEDWSADHKWQRGVRGK